MYSLNFVFILLHSSKLSISFFQNKVPYRQGKESLAMKELFKVLKDQNNKFMQDLVTASYQIVMAWMVTTKNPKKKEQVTAWNRD